MKQLLIAAAALVLGFSAQAQYGELPDTQIKNVSTGKKLPFYESVTKGKVTVISFWATWCVPCKKEIKNIRDRMPEWKKEADFDYVTVSIDESRAEGLVRSYAISQGWEFPFYIDPNSDLKRSFNFQTVPFTVVIDKAGAVAYSHIGYEEGGENEVWAKVKELARK